MGETGVAGRLKTDPELRWTSYMFGRVYEDVPQGVWWAPGKLTLLGGPETAFTVALPWGAVVAASPCADGSQAYSLNHHDGRLALSPDTRTPPWARPCLRALETAPAGAGLRMAVNRTLPDRMGLLSGTEMSCAVSLALRDLHGMDPPSAGLRPPYAPAHALLLRAGSVAEPVPFDLSAAGLRLLLVEPGHGDTEPALSHARAGDAAGAAEAVRGGNLAILGGMLTQAHRPGNRPVDLALDAALAAGALGGRGIGRCAVALAPIDRMPEIRAAVTARLHGIARRPPRFLTAVPTGAACRVA